MRNYTLPRVRASRPKMKKGVTVTCVMDCCHSGTVLDLPYQYVANDGMAGHGFEERMVVILVRK
jgi:hypothetical protein